MLKLTLQNDLSEIGRLAEAVEAFGCENGISIRDTYAVNLALDEMVCNIMSYGYRTGQPDGSAPGATIEVEVSLDGDCVRAEIVDSAPPFDPLQRPEPDLTLPLDSRPIGGLGIHFARKAMDHIEYRYENGRNHLIMKKKLQSSG